MGVMRKIQKIIKQVFSTPDNIDEMSFLEIVIDGLFEGIILGVIINFIKFIFYIIILIVLIVLLSILF
jgi:hypothetical protein